MLPKNRNPDLMRGQYFLRNSFHVATRNLLAKDKLDDCEKTQVICNYKCLVFWL